jgi:hypothetical protein
VTGERQKLPVAGLRDFVVDTTLPYVFSPEVVRHVLTVCFGEYRQNGNPRYLGLYTALGGDVIKRAQECWHRFLQKIFTPSLWGT